MTARAALKRWTAEVILGLALGVLLAGFVYTCTAHGSTPDRVHAAISSLPLFHEDRGAPGKAEQLKAIGDAVARHSKDPRVQAFVIAWGWHESGFSLNIGAGRCRPLQCDRGRARGPFQEHRIGRPLAEWERLHGLENIDFQIASATRRARGMLGMCGSVEGALRAMTGRGCSAALPGVEKRVATYQLVRARL